MSLYYDVVLDDDLGCIVAIRDDGPSGQILSIGYDAGEARQ